MAVHVHLLHHLFFHCARYAQSHEALTALRADLIGCMEKLVLAMLLGVETWSIWNRLGTYAAICSEEAFSSTPVSVHNNTQYLLVESHPHCPM